VRSGTPGFEIGLVGPGDSEPCNPVVGEGSSSPGAHSAQLAPSALIGTHGEPLFPGSSPADISRDCFRSQLLGAGGLSRLSMAALFGLRPI
jgi:hypothetical protein